jgi:hypothetical protein
LQAIFYKSGISPGVAVLVNQPQKGSQPGTRAISVSHSSKTNQRKNKGKENKSGNYQHPISSVGIVEKQTRNAM